MRCDSLVAECEFMCIKIVLRSLQTILVICTAYIKFRRGVFYRFYSFSTLMILVVLFQFSFLLLKPIFDILQ